MRNLTCLERENEAILGEGVQESSCWEFPS